MNHRKSIYQSGEGSAEQVRLQNALYGIKTLCPFSCGKLKVMLEIAIQKHSEAAGRFQKALERNQSTALIVSGGLRCANNWLSVYPGNLC